MTRNPGTYVLLLRSAGEQEIEVGALGKMTVHSGAYVYVGSAFGPGGLRARVERHIGNDGTLHWHIDYLRAATTLEAVWYTHDPQRRECTWAEIVRSLPGATVPVSGFGASDCNCSAHLVRMESTPILWTFRTRIGARCPNHAAVESVDRELVD